MWPQLAALFYSKNRRRGQRMKVKDKLDRVGSTLSQLGVIMLSLSATAMLAQAPAPAKWKPPTTQGLTLATRAFDDGGIIPNKYTQANTTPPVSPDLEWTHAPNGTMSFVLIVNDPDTAPDKLTEVVLHWLIFNIPGTASGLPEGVPNDAHLADGSVQALNRAQTVGYEGMGAGPAGPYHHYTFELYALDTKLALGPTATRADVLAAMNGHILAKAVLVGRFHLPQGPR
jgi:Raf kinase inhibitor-like YbhB/YbcL family protein